MAIEFSKYHGTLNDFIVCDNRKEHINANQINELAKLCHRHSGIGADGILFLNEGGSGFDYKMQFINPDGREVAFCGNGSRCLFQFAIDLGIVHGKAYFDAGDGPHKASISSHGVKIQMKRATEIYPDPQRSGEIQSDFRLYNTGVEHLVIPVDDVETIDLDSLGWKYRPDGNLLANGVNVNIFDRKNDKIHVRTFERGVDAETWSCGTGNVAVAYHLIKNNIIRDNRISLLPKGGNLVVEFPEGIDGNPWLHGNAIKVYSGIVI